MPGPRAPCPVGSGGRRPRVATDQHPSMLHSVRLGGERRRSGPYAPPRRPHRPDARTRPGTSPSPRRSALSTATACPSPRGRRREAPARRSDRSTPCRGRRSMLASAQRSCVSGETTGLRPGVDETQGPDSIANLDSSDSSQENTTAAMSHRKRRGGMRFTAAVSPQVKRVIPLIGSSAHHQRQVRTLGAKGFTLNASPRPHEASSPRLRCLGKHRDHSASRRAPSGEGEAGHPSS